MATFYFSSSTGKNIDDPINPGDGTINKPWYALYPNKSGTNALNPGDICLYKAGDTWTGDGNYQIIDSNGTAGNLITFDRYGSGADPIFTTANIQTGWTLVGVSTNATGGNIYSKSGMFDDTFTIGVDGTYALGKWQGTATSLPKGSFKNGSTIYINLSDGSNPSGHTIWVPGRYQFDENRGIVRGSDGAGRFCSINHFKVMYANGIGISFNNPDSTVNDCTAIGNGRDGIAFQGYTPQGWSPDRCRMNRCYMAYNNAAGDGKGQAFTSYGSYTWAIDSTSEYNFKEGFDFISTGTVAQGGYSIVTNSGLIRCTSYKNGQNVSSSFGSSGIYLDGCHDMLVWGCVSHGSGTGNDIWYASNIAADTERSFMGVYNIHVVNCLAYEASAWNLNINNHSGSPSIYGCTVVNNTFVRGAGLPGDYGGTFNIGTLTSTTKSIIKNNIFYRSAQPVGNNPPTTHALPLASSLTSANVDMDYNCFYDPNKTKVIATGESSPAYTLAEWKTFNNNLLDSHSIQADPKLTNISFSAFDAHLSTSPASPCIAVGTPIAPWTPPQWVIDAGVLADNGAVVGTTRADGVADTGTFDMGYHYPLATVGTGTLASTNVQPATLYVATINTDVITFTTVNAIPANGKIIITYPVALAGGFAFNAGSGTSFATVQAGTQNTSATGTLTIAMTATTQGNLVVGFLKGPQTVTLSNVIDDMGNTYVISTAKDSSTTLRLYQFYGIQVTGGSTNVICTITGTGNCRGGADEFSGNGTTNSSAFDVTATGSGTGTAIATSALTPTATGELIVSSFAQPNAATYTAGASYTLYSGTNPVSSRQEYRLSGGASETAPVTSDTSQDWAEIATAFKGSTPSAASFNSGGSGSLSVAVVGNVVTLTRSGGSVIAAAQAVSINLTNVKNPIQVGSTGAYAIKTTDSTGATIDQDTNVSADQIISAAQSTVTITIKGVSMKNVHISSS